jgi:outer membrane lipoprotein SlyB
MAAVLVQQRAAPEPQPAAAVAMPLAVSAVQALEPPTVQSQPAKPVAKKLVSKVPAVPVEYAQTAPEKVAKVPSTVVEPAASSPEPTPSVLAQSPKEVCINCGTVESVTPVQREAAPSGAGALAGAVLGGLVGNQFGGGDGKTIVTMIGVMGGGWAGNTVEKRMKVQTLYQVTVRMDDGSTRAVEQAALPAVGTRVTVEGNVLTPAGSI